MVSRELHSPFFFKLKRVCNEKGYSFITLRKKKLISLSQEHSLNLHNIENILSINRSLPKNSKENLREASLHMEEILHQDQCGRRRFEDYLQRLFFSNFILCVFFVLYYEYTIYFTFLWCEFKINFKSKWSIASARD